MTDKPDVMPILFSYHLKELDIPAVREAGSLTMVVAIPWAMLVPHEATAIRNHNQSLSRLRERGGLGWQEALAILEDREFFTRPRYTAAQANERLKRLIGEWASANEVPM